MPSKTYTNEEIIGYLLDAMPEAETVGLEQAYFEDSTLAVTVSEVENNLIDDYIRGQLPRREQELFEKHYLSHPNRRHRVENARDLITTLDLLKKQPPANEKASRWGYLFDVLRGRNLSLAYPVIALLLIVFGCFYLWRLNNQSRTSQIAQSGKDQYDHSPQISPTPQDKQPPAKEIAQSQNRPFTNPPRSNDVSEIPSLMLTSGMVRRGRRGGKSPSQFQVITAKNKKIRIILKTESTDYQSYTAQIWTDEEPGINLFTVPNKIKPNRQEDMETLVIIIPTSPFKKGISSYKLVLKGIMASGEEQVSPIPFRIEKR